VSTTGLPTQNRIPHDGVTPLSTTLDSIGPLANSVACCAVTDAVIAGELPIVPPPIPAEGLRPGVPAADSARQVTQERYREEPSSCGSPLSHWARFPASIACRGIQTIFQSEIGLPSATG
jgi:hypothetical protein